MTFDRSEIVYDRKAKNDLFYVCSLIEYIARQTQNKRGIVVKILGREGIEKQLYDAEVNHCLSFEQVSDEIIQQYKIPEGTFDTITECKYAVAIKYLIFRQIFTIRIQAIWNVLIRQGIYWTNQFCFRVAGCTAALAEQGA